MDSRGVVASDRVFGFENLNSSTALSAFAMNLTVWTLCRTRKSSKFDPSP
jgi:hypothetical protein